MKNLLISSVLFIVSTIFTFGQNTSSLEKSLNYLNNAYNSKTKFSIVSDQLIIKIYSNNELVRTDKIYFDDLSVNGIFYNEQYKTITIKCASNDCVDRKLYKDRAKKIAKSCSIPTSFDNNDKVKSIVSNIRNIISEFKQNKIVVVDNTEAKQVSDLSNHLISTNILDLAKKNISLNYEYFFSNNKIGARFSGFYSPMDNSNSYGINLKFYKNRKAGLFKFGDVKLGQGMTSFFIGPEFKNTSTKSGSYVSALANGGISLQLAVGINLTFFASIGGAHYHLIKITPEAETFFDYDLNISLGWRF